MEEEVKINEETQQQQVEPKELAERCSRIAQNAALFLDRSKPSALGKEGKMQIREHTVCIELLEEIVEGRLVIVSADLVKDIFNKDTAADPKN